MMRAYRNWNWQDDAPAHTVAFLLPRILELAGPIVREGARVLDVGCGNGYLAGQFLSRGCAVVGIDLSQQGIAIARRSHPAGRFEVLPADDKILSALGEHPFDLVISTEVVEHLYDPRSFVRGCFTAVRPGGRFVCSTPYHGYLKNLVLALAGKWDAHANPLWDGGHIKFWSRRTLSRLLTEAGFVNVAFRGAGRFPYLWMSMVMAGDRPR
jgi:2-polyprenyl-3-methyl-5-hydroxy-6-metoxy-1,4-benzoquinol methylase